MDLLWKQGRLHGLCLKSREGGLKETPQDGPEVLGHRQWVQACKLEEQAVGGCLRAERMLLLQGQVCGLKKWELFPVDQCGSQKRVRCSYLRS